MSDEELLQRISELESAGVFSKEEADAKRKPIEDRIAKAKADAEEAERLAHEEEEKARAATQAKADEFWKKIETAEGDDFVEKAFGLLVPQSGSCNTLAGELIRAIMKIMYRDFNDGDVFYDGYGLETAGPAAAFIADKIPEADTKLQEIAEDGLDGDYYTKALKDVASIIEDFIRDNPNSLTDEFSEDMYDWDGNGWREFAPTYETDIELPRELEAHIEKGNISERDLIDEIEYWEWNDKTGDEDFSIDWGNVLYINGLSREGKDDWERNGWDWLEQYAKDLTNEYGDPEFDIRDELTVDDILEVLPTSHDPETEMKAARALYKYIQEGNLWDDLDGDPRDGAISYAREFVDSFERDLSGNAHYYDSDFEYAGITEDQVKAILTCLGADEEAVANYHLGGEEEEEVQEESLKEAMTDSSDIMIDTGLTGQHDKSILDSILGQLSDGYWENSPRMEKYWKNLGVKLDNDKVMIVAPKYYRQLFGWNDENDVKKFFARCLKTFVKHAIDDYHWASEWSRTCEDQLKGFHEPTTVKEVYRVYDKLLNRKDRIEKEELTEAPDTSAKFAIEDESGEGTAEEKLWGHDDQKNILIRADKAEELGIDPLEHATIEADLAAELNSQLPFSTGFDFGEDVWVIIGDDEDDYKEIEAKLFGTKVEDLKEAIDKNAKEIIAKNKNRDNVWYLDVKGNNGWMSGNTMNQGACGYGGFYSFDKAKELFDNFEKIVKFDEESIEEYHSEGESTFKPSRVYIGFAPIEDEDDEYDNSFVMERAIIKNESLEEEKEVLHKDSPLKAKLFMCDGLEATGVGAFEGYDLGAFWNGWSCPAFEKETAQKIMNVVNELDPETIEFTFDEANDQFVEVDHTYDDDVSEKEPNANKVFYEGKDHMTEDGVKHLYSIGAWEWTWFETNPEEDADTTFDDYLVTDFPDDYFEEK